MCSMRSVQLPEGLASRIRQLEQEAYSYLVVGDFPQAERIYRQQYEILRTNEQHLSPNEKYHKGAPLHNWGTSLLLQKRILAGFQKITLAYIEDLLNFDRPEDALGAPAYKTLRSYPLIATTFLDRIRELAIRRREQDRVPKDPEEIRNEYREAGYADLPSTFTEDRIKETPITIDQLKPLIEAQLKKQGPKEKRVFVGGSYKNIALLRYIAQIVEDIDDFKAIIPIDLPKLSADPYDHLIHDTSMEYLRGCSYAVFEVSVSDGHLMEIERASDMKERGVLEILLVFQRTKAEDKPMLTRMVMTTNFQKRSYHNFTELTKEIVTFLQTDANASAELGNLVEMS